MFKRRFLICLGLTLPVLYFAPSFQQWFNYQAIQFPGSHWVTPILSTAIYSYGGYPLSIPIFGLAQSGERGLTCG